MHRFFRHSLLVLFGAALLYFALVVCGARLAAIAVPMSYSEFFGKDQAALAMFVLGLVMFALPIGLLFLIGTFIALRPSRTALKPAALAMLVGMLAAFLYLHVDMALSMSTDRGALSMPFGRALATSILPTWQVLPGLLAPWIGFFAAIVLFRRRSLPPNHR